MKGQRSKRRPTYITNSVNKTKSSCYTPELLSNTVSPETNPVFWSSSGDLPSQHLSKARATFALGSNDEIKSLTIYQLVYPTVKYECHTKIQDMNEIKHKKKLIILL